MTSNMDAIKQQAKANKKKIDKKILRKVFFRSIHMEHSWNYERMMNLGYCYAMIPALKAIYSDDSTEMKLALKRHMEFYNTTPYVITLPLGISVAMEEKRSENKEEFDTATISAVKTAIMGPLAGIGDSFFWGTLRILATGVGTSLAVKGNILGPILFFLIYNVPHFSLRYWFTFLGYNFGTNFLTKVEETGIMDKLMYGASIVGLTVAGAMSAEMVYLEVAGKIGSGDDATAIQAILDGIVPGLLPLLLTGLVYYLINNKKWKPLPLMLGLMVICVLASWAGILNVVE